MASSSSSLNLASLVMPTETLTAALTPAPSYGALPSLNPPLFFEIVEDQVYRSNKCDSSSFPYLATLHLNTVVYLSYDDLTRELVDFFKEKEINVYRNLASSIKTRFENEQFIELFDVDLVTLPQQLPDWFVLNQTLMEQERIALMKGECYPGLKRDAIKEKSGSTDADDAPITPAYQKYYFYLQGPLASPSVKFSEKKSIIGDDDDD